MPLNTEILASNLRGFRARKRMTQSEVASAIGVTTQTIANYEDGKPGMSYENAWALADLYGVTLSALGGRNEEMCSVK